MVTAIALIICVLIVIAIVGGIIAFLCGAAIAFIPAMFKLGMIVVPVIFLLVLVTSIFSAF